MPAGFDVTVPAPAPARATVSVYWLSVKVAVTIWAAFIVTMHAPVPAHAPDQPVKVEPAVAAWVSVTTVPGAKVAVQVAPQAMPAGFDVTVPLPLPARVTTRLRSRANAAWIDRSSVTVVVHVPAPVQPPPVQPTKVDPTAGAAVSVTWAP
jgi:hypothetical protein